MLMINNTRRLARPYGINNQCRCWNCGKRLRPGGPVVCETCKNNSSGAVAADCNTDAPHDEAAAATPHFKE